MTTPPAPTSYPTADSFQDLVATALCGATNAACWPRQLTGDFAEIVQLLTAEDKLTVVSPDELKSFTLSDQGQLARNVLLRDLERLTNYGAAPVLNLIRSYDRDDSYPFFPTDVYSWHVDRSPLPTDTFLCTYHGATSDILPYDQAEQKILVPEIRAELLKLHGEGERGFDAFLTEYYFDLHYRAKPGAQPINLQTGHLWRLATDHPNGDVLPCVHRAPVERAGELRLMIIC